MNKSELRRYRFICIELDQLSEQITEVKSKMLSPKNQVITGMPRGGSGNSDKIGEVLCKVERLEGKYLDKYNQLLQEREKIEDAIAPLESKERLLIRYRYIYGYSWEVISEKLKYSIDNVYKLHGKILQKIAKKY